MARKCYNCRADVTGDNIRCADCKDVAIKTTSTYIIFDKM